MGQRKRRGSTGVAEGMHGPKTHRAVINQLQAGPAAGSEEREGKQQAGMSEHPKREGHARLVEGREQHDEADKNSDANRLHKDLSRGRRTAGVDAPSDTPESPKS